jgi:Tfp pilus assembly protein PilN
MRAVNLIPRDERRVGAPGGRSANGAYAVVAGLGLLLMLVVLYVASANSVHDRKAQLAQIKIDTAAAQSEAASLKPYGDFAQLRKERIAAVKSIATDRFNWALAVRDLSVAMPADVKLSALDANVNSDLNGNPGMKLDGCTKGQRSVAGMMASLRQVAGVNSVDLASSSNSATAPGCTTQFTVNIVFQPTVLPTAATSTDTTNQGASK